MSDEQKQKKNEADRAALREFFLEQLDALELNTGCDQFIRIQRSPNVVQDTDKLLNILVGVCMAPPFDLIPAVTKMRVIADQMVADPKFSDPGYGQVSGFNQAIVRRWLNGFWQTHMEALMRKSVEPEKPVQLSPEDEAKVNELLENWKRSLMGKTPDYGDIEAEKRKIEAEDAERQEGKKSAGYKVDPVKIIQRELHDLWIRENFDLNGKKLATWMSEDSWLEMKAAEEADRPEPSSLT